MSYLRVIPRDLFNESNLLKCMGQLYLCLERVDNSIAWLEHDDAAFDIQQSDDDGSTWVENVTLYRVLDGVAHPVHLHRPMNSREPWPLYATGDYDCDVPVFNPDGTLSREFRSLLGV